MVEKGNILARTIAVAMRKGGSGKTTTTINVAAALAKRGKKVLLVDLDPQANATVAVGINPLEIKHHIGNLLADSSIDPFDAPIKIDFGLENFDFYVLPSHVDLAKLENGMGAADVHALKQTLEPLQRVFDYILIDTPPSESPLTISGLVAAEEVIISLQAHFFALEGLDMAMNQVDKVRSGLNKNLRVVGILPTMVNPRTNISRVIIADATKNYPNLVYPFSVDYSVRHPEATLEGKPIVVLDPTHSGAIAYQKLAEVLDGEN